MTSRNQSFGGGNVSVLTDADAQKHPIFRHYNIAAGTWANGQPIPITLLPIKGDEHLFRPTPAGIRSGHPSGIDLAHMQAVQQDHNRMENDRQFYLARQQRAELQQQQQHRQQQQLELEDSDDESTQRRSRRPPPKKAVRRVVQFKTSARSDAESESEDDASSAVEPQVRVPIKKSASRTKTSSLANQLDSVESKKKKNSR
jgi:hypothetical protein